MVRAQWFERYVSKEHNKVKAFQRWNCLEWSLSKWKMLFCSKFPLEFSSSLNSLPFRMLIGTEKHANHMARSNEPIVLREELNHPKLA